MSSSWYRKRTTWSEIFAQHQKGEEFNRFNFQFIENIKYTGSHGKEGSILGSPSACEKVSIGVEIDSACSYVHAISVETMTWSGEHRAFVVQEFFRDGDSPIISQLTFRDCFTLGRHDSIPKKKTIHNWVSIFRETSSAIEKACFCPTFIWLEVSENPAPWSETALQ